MSFGFVSLCLLLGFDCYCLCNKFMFSTDRLGQLIDICQDMRQT